MARGHGMPPYPKPGRLDRALDLLFPPVCVGCRRIGRWICPRCWRTVPWYDTCEYLDILQHTPADDPSHHLQRVYAVTEFSGVAREAVHAFKYHRRFAIASLMGMLMADMVVERDIDLVISVPLHRKRRRRRGYDQAAMLAKHVARSLNVKHEANLIRRVKQTKEQNTLSREERHANVSGAFKVRRSFSGERVLLIDDVYTTGATMHELARVLRNAGAGQVIGVVFARAPAATNTSPVVLTPTVATPRGGSL